MTNETNANRCQPIRVTFFGDSTCVGQGVSIYRGWVTQIAQYLDEYGRQLGREFVVSNASINGRTTRQALEDMPYHVQSHGVDLLVVQFGLNDCNYWATDKGLPRVSLSAFVANLREITARGLHFGAFKVLLNNNHPTSRSKGYLPGTKLTYEDSNRKYNQAIRNVVSDLGPCVVFQDIEQYFSDLVAHGEKLDQFLLDDGLHLSIKGHDEYYKVMQQVISSAVSEFLIAESSGGGVISGSASRGSGGG